MYIHIPFCSHKCHYCDFYSIVDTQDRQEPFVERLIHELTALAPLASGAPLLTIFVGGGTPSLLRIDLWKRLLATLRNRFDFSEIDKDSGEFTVECNPESITPELLDVLRAGGVSRISMGAQSFNATHLRILERHHSPANVERAVHMVRAAGIPRQSVDLIFGVPGQTLDDWKTDLARAISLGTEHLSCYNLTYEPNTAMTARLARGEFDRADEDLEVEMYHATLTTLRAAGLDRYEVSNYSKPGRECRHNMAYWRQEEWLAAGPSASAHVAGHRWKNAPRLDDYLRLSADGLSMVVDLERADPARALRERIMTGTRLAEGLDSAATLAAAEQVSGANAVASIQAKVNQFTQGGWIKPNAPRWQLTDAGFLFADTVAERLMAAIK